MLPAGDAFLQTQGGNNNPYNQDNPTSWIDRDRLRANREIFRVVCRLIAFQKAHPSLCRSRFWRAEGRQGYGGGAVYSGYSLSRHTGEGTGEGRPIQRLGLFWRHGRLGVQAEEKSMPRDYHHYDGSTPVQGEHPHARHGAHPAQTAGDPMAHNHDKHAGHSPEMFRHRFWLSSLLTLPILYFDQHVQAWFGYQAVAFPGAAWVQPLLSVGLYLYGGVVFVQGASRALEHLAALLPLGPTAWWESALRTSRSATCRWETASSFVPVSKFPRTAWCWRAPPV
jgi:hypothetical protein